jgi:hypothetical protein
VSSRLNWKRWRPLPSGKRNRSRCKRGAATKVRWDCIMSSVPAPVRDCSGTQLLDSPGEVHLSDHRLARPCRRRVTQHSHKRYLRGNSSDLRGPFRRPTLRRRLSQSTEDKDTESRGIPERICHGHRTACPQRLPYTTRRTHKERGSQSVKSQKLRVTSNRERRASEDSRRKWSQFLISSVQCSLCGRLYCNWRVLS